MFTMPACFMKFAYYQHVQNHLYKKTTLIASKVFLGLETIITTHKKKIRKKE
jgi:hypothetical protein